MAGEGSWVKIGEAGCEDVFENCEAPTETHFCVMLYSECGYTGMNTKICDDTPFTDIDYEVKSIKVPEDRTIYLYNLPCFNGQNAQFTQDVECLDHIEFSML